MASRFSDIKEDKNALCYVWLTLALLIVSALCFAAASAQNYLVYVGIFFIVFASISAFAYLSRYVVRKNSCCTYYCKSCSYCCDDCCGICCRTILCLPPDDSPPSMSISRRDRHRIDAIQRSLNTSQDNSRHRATIAYTGEVTSIPISETPEAKFQALDEEIKRLRQDYDFLTRQDCVDSVVQLDYEHLDMEEVRLLSWKENQIIPSLLELKAMKGRLKRIARNFRLARSRISSHQGVGADMESGLTLNVDMDAPEQVRVFAQDVPVPPQYSETDPQPTSTKRFSEENMLEQRPYVIPATSQPSTINPQMGPPSSGRSSSAVTLSRSAFMPSRSGAYVNAAFIGNLTANDESPPVYEQGSPPSYEEATASPI